MAEIKLFVLEDNITEVMKKILEEFKISQHTIVSYDLGISETKDTYCALLRISKTIDLQIFNTERGKELYDTLENKIIGQRAFMWVPEGAVELDKYLIVDKEYPRM
jgi:hypothetical protein